MDTSSIYNPDDTICAIATPQGTGAIAMVRLSGPDAFTIADKVWQGRSLARATTHTAHLGYIVDHNSGDTIDQAVATVFRAPNSFTGDDTVEFAIHGSRWIQRRVIKLLTDTGARLALPGEYTRRAYATGRLDLAEAEAVADVIAASSQAAHRLAMNQMRGHYSTRLNTLRDELIELASLLELELDFSEEDVEFASRERLGTLATELHDKLSALASTFDAGAAIKDGIPVAIVGPTNAGKSSLLNTLLGDERAIVSDIHGTTRDIVEDTIEIGPYLIRFKDTAGLRETTDTIERIGIDRSRQAARTARVVILVIDPANPPAEADAASIAALTNPESIIVAINKHDLYPDSDITLPAALSASPTVRISAKNSQGINALKETIKTVIDKTSGIATDSDIIITNARHATALAAAASSAKAVADGLAASLPPDFIAQDLRETIHHLSTITGTITTPDILQSIFTKFCIGK